MYKRMSVEDFHSRMAEGMYSSYKQAHMAINRAIWPKKQKETALEAVNNYFGVKPGGEFYVAKGAEKAAKERVATRQRAHEDKVAEESPAIQFAVDFQAIKNSRLRPEFRRLLQTAKRLNVGVEELITALG